MSYQPVGVTLSFNQADTDFRGRLEQELAGVEIKKLEVGAVRKEGAARRVRSAVGDVVTVIGVVLSAAQLAASVYQILREHRNTSNQETNVTITVNKHTIVVHSDMDAEVVSDKILEIVKKPNKPD